MVTAGIALTALCAGGAAGAVADAHKTVTIDIDGRIVQVGTFAGSIGSLLDAQGVRLGERDVVSPSADARLRDDADVVVRYGRELTVEADGAQTQVWVAALDAREALRHLAGRGDDVRLVASRAGGRTSLPIRLAADGGDVTIEVDGASHTVSDTGEGIEALLGAVGIEVDDDDRVSVVASGAGVVVMVQRVVTADVTTTQAVPFERVEQDDPDRFSDLDPKVVQSGVEGALTRVERVTTVDGAEVERTVVSEVVTTQPVTEVVAVGTRERSDTVPTEGVWAALAQCESGGRVDAVSANGLYHGLYQFSVATWQAMGGSGLPSEASAQEQTQRAQALQAQSGWGQWPACSRRLGLL